MGAGFPGRVPHPSRVLCGRVGPFVAQARLLSRNMNFSAPLRRELAQRALKFAETNSLPHSLSYGETPVVCFAPEASRHGNFMAASYKAILANPNWRRRLAKIHGQGKKSLPTTD